MCDGNRKSFTTCDFSIPELGGGMIVEIIDGWEMSEQDIQAVEDKYPGIFTTPHMNLNMKVVPHDNPIHFCNLDFTQGMMPVPTN